MKISTQEINQAVEKHGGKRPAARALGIPYTTLCSALKHGAGFASTKPAKTEPPRKGRTLADFRSEYDKSYIVPRKIKAAIVELGVGGWEYEVAFAKMAGVSTTDLSAFRDQFADHVVSLRERRAWAGSKATAKAMREML